MFRDPTGRVIGPQGERRPVAVDVDEVVRGWIERPITPQTNAPGWDGLQVDHDRCVGALSQVGPGGAAGSW